MLGLFVFIDLALFDSLSLSLPFCILEEVWVACQRENRMREVDQRVREVGGMEGSSGRRKGGETEGG